jgi:WD40 repeat protein
VETERPVGPSFESSLDAQGKQDDRSNRYYVNAVTYSSDGERIYGKMGGRLIVWDAKSGAILQDVHQVREEFDGLAISPDGNSIAGATNRIVKVWDLKTGIEQFSFKGHEQDVSCIAFSPDPTRSRIVSGSGDGTAKVWDLDPDRELLTRSDQGRDARNGIHTVDHSREGGLVLTSSWETVKVWRSDNLSLLSTVELNRQSRSAISPDGQRFVTGKSVWNARTGEKIRDFDETADDFSACAFSPDGRFIAAAHAKAVRIWNADTYQELTPLVGHAGEVLAIALSPDGRRVATASKDQSIRVWDTETGRELRILKGKIWAWTRTVAFSPDGRRIVTGAEDFDPRVYDTETGEELLALKGHAAPITTVAFSPDGRRIASAGYDGMVKLWDAQTGRELLSFDGNNARTVYSLVFSPDGKRIIGGRADNAVSVWKAADPAELSQWQAAERKANLLREERAVTLDALRAEDPGAIKKWLLLAPIAFEGNDPVAALDQEPLPNEPQLRPRADQRVTVGKSELAWKAVRQQEYRLDFSELLGKEIEYSVVYAVSYIHSETAHTNLMIKIGSDDQAKIFLNEKEVYRNSNGRGYISDEDTVTGIELNAGVNVLVFKVVNGIMGWAGSVWITDAKGQPVQGITVSLDPDGKE